jgi:hypothetical protein
MVVHAMEEHDQVVTINFCHWCLQSVRDGEVYLQCVFSDETYL